MIQEFIDKIGTSIADWFHMIWDPWVAALILFEWWALFILFVIVCMVIGYFFQFKWVRAVLGVMILIAGAFVLGGTKMYRDLKPHIGERRRRVLNPPPPPPQDPERPEEQNRPWWPFNDHSAS